MITVYSTDTCPYCHALMDWLEDLGVEFEEVKDNKVYATFSNNV